MDLAPLRDAHAALLNSAASQTFDTTSEDGWNAAQVLAHLIITNRDVAALCSLLSWGLDVGYDNRSSQTPAYLDAVVRRAGDWQNLVETLRRGCDELCDVLASIGDDVAERRFVVAGVNGDRDVVMEMTVAEFVAGLAATHLPAHQRQLLALAASPV